MKSLHLELGRLAVVYFFSLPHNKFANYCFHLDIRKIMILRNFRRNLCESFRAGDPWFRRPWHMGSSGGRHKDFPPRRLGGDFCIKDSQGPGGATLCSNLRGVVGDFIPRTLLPTELVPPCHSTKFGNLLNSQERHFAWFSPNLNDIVSPLVPF